MGIIARKNDNEKTFEPIPQGLHLAICYGIFDIGTHLSEKYKTKYRKIIIVWELPEDRIKIEKEDGLKDLPRAFSNQYTLSLGDNSFLRRDLESWRGKGFSHDELKGFDITKLLGVACQLNIIHKQEGDKLYQNLSGIVQAPKGYKPILENPKIYYSIEEHGEDIPDATPDWIVKKIKSCEEWNAQDVSVPLDVSLEELGEMTEMGDDQIPF